VEKPKPAPAKVPEDIPEWAKVKRTDTRIKRSPEPVVNEGLALQLRIRIEQEEAKHKARIEVLREWLDYETKRTAG
jgi:hypothetical protein